MEFSMVNANANIRVVMFPWLAHGHISPYLELAKRLTKRNFTIYLCSTPANLVSVKPKIGEKLAHSIHIVELHLPVLPGLPPHYHTTNGLPPHLMPSLKKAFRMSAPDFEKILANIKPDLLIYDFLQPWAPLAASILSIPAVEFITSSCTMTSYMFHFFKNPTSQFPFSDTIFYRDYEQVHLDTLLESTTNEQAKIKAFEGVDRSSKIILVKGFKEIEGQYCDYLSDLLAKKIVPVGPLVQEPIHEDEDSDIISWLDEKDKKSTVFVSFGSEYFLSREEILEIAYGLELSNVNFVWVIRFPKGQETCLDECLPKGYFTRVGKRGKVVEGWAPQARILGHSSIGGFVSHCGCSSMMESMKFGIPIIAMPMHLDQPINARMVGNVGVGLEVVRSADGKLQGENLAAVIRQVVVEDAGDYVRKKSKDMSQRIGAKGDAEIDDVVEEFVRLCKDKNQRNGNKHLLDFDFRVLTL